MEIQSRRATTQPAGSGTEALQEMAPGRPGVGAQAFFNLLLTHTIGGFFADPVHGGNRDMVGYARRSTGHLASPDRATVRLMLRGELYNRGSAGRCEARG